MSDLGDNTLQTMVANGINTTAPQREPGDYQGIDRNSPMALFAYRITEAADQLRPGVNLEHNVLINQRQDLTDKDITFLESLPMLSSFLQVSEAGILCVRSDFGAIS